MEDESEDGQFDGAAVKAICTKVRAVKWRLAAHFNRRDAQQLAQRRWEYKNKR